MEVDDVESLDVRNLHDWTPTDIERWVVETCQLSHDIFKVFVTNGIQKGKQLLSLTPEICQQMGITLIGDRLSISTAVHELQQGFYERHNRNAEEIMSNNGSDSSASEELIRGLAKTQTYQHLTNSLGSEVRALRAQLQDKSRRVADPSNPLHSYHLGRNLKAIRNGVNQIVGRELLYEFVGIDDTIDIPTSHDDHRYEDISDIKTISLKIVGFIQQAVGALLTGSQVRTFLDNTDGDDADGIAAWYRVYDELYVGMKATSKYGTTYLGAFNSMDQDPNAPPNQLLANREENYSRFQHTMRVLTGDIKHPVNDNALGTVSASSHKEMLAYITVHAARNHNNDAVREMADQVIRLHIGGKLCVNANEMSWMDTVTQLHSVYERDTEQYKQGFSRGVTGKKQNQDVTVLTTHGTPTMTHRETSSHGGTADTHKQSNHGRKPKWKGKRNSGQLDTGKSEIRSNGGKHDNKAVGAKSPHNISSEKPGKGDSYRVPDGKTTPTDAVKHAKLVPPEAGQGTEPFSKLASILKKRGMALCTQHDLGTKRNKFLFIQGETSFLWHQDRDLVFPLQTVNGFPTLISWVFPTDTGIWDPGGEKREYTRQSLTPFILFDDRH